VKYDLLPLDRGAWFTLWQVKMLAILTQDEVDDALHKFGKKYSKAWTHVENKKHHKALT
jgi:hypothetical protein